MQTPPILLVDDEPDIREVLSISLVDAGYTVYTAESAAQALEIMNEAAPSIVLTDIKMPGMDGIELLEKIKHEYPETEVIMITGHGDMDVAIKSLRNEAIDFITKPINDHALDAALKKAREKLALREKMQQYTQNLENMILEKSRQLSVSDAKGGADGQRPALSTQTAFEGLPCFIAVLNRKFYFTTTNRWFKDTFDGRLQEQRCYEICKQNDRPCRECPAAATFGDGQPHEAKSDFATAGGRQYPVLVWTSPIRDAEGVIHQVLVMATPIDRLADLQDHLSSLGLMVGSVSHGLKGLLTGLDGGMYMLDSGLAKADTEQAKEGLQMVKSMTERIRNLVLDLLFYAKKRELTKQSVNVAEFAKDVAAVVDAKFKWQQIGFSLDFENASGEFSVDAAMLRSALVNILENAMDACMADKNKPGRISFTAAAENAHIRFVIEDNGIGMDEETKANIFTLFFSSKGRQGTGLGLFIADKVVSEHGGTIQMESTIEQGSRFVITIPRE
ncbi:MAG: hybrid sensor histidine kinase/response regulator [Desulfosalsimonadaceae bacterium]